MARISPKSDTYVQAAEDGTEREDRDHHDQVRPDGVVLPAGVVMEAIFEPQNGGCASNLRVAADSLLMLIVKRSRSRTGPAQLFILCWRADPLPSLRS
jgi:hypothetical protein